MALKRGSRFFQKYMESYAGLFAIGRPSCMGNALTISTVGRLAPVAPWDSSKGRVAAAQRCTLPISWPFWSTRAPGYRYLRTKIASGFISTNHSFSKSGYSPNPLLVR